ncbi:MAG: CBS domain-containing protein [Halobacteriota archaeon]
MIEIPVSTAVTDGAPVVGADCSVRDAACHLRDPTVPALIVQDDEGEITGIVTESDVVAIVAEGGFSHTVASCMSSPVITVSPTTPVGLAADRMRDAGITLLAVVDEDDEYHGLATRETLSPYLSRQRLGITWNGERLALEAESPEEAESADATTPEAEPSDAA